MEQAFENKVQSLKPARMTSVGRVQGSKVEFCSKGYHLLGERWHFLLPNVELVTPGHLLNSF
jgi:hypothetical protein